VAGVEREVRGGEAQLPRRQLLQQAGVLARLRQQLMASRSSSSTRRALRPRAPLAKRLAAAAQAEHAAE
jgi:hypothetical protein